MISILPCVPVYISSSFRVHHPFFPHFTNNAQVPSHMHVGAEGAGNRGGW
jgi:hypothetical protein